MVSNRSFLERSQHYKPLCFCGHMFYFYSVTCNIIKYNVNKTMLLLATVIKNLIDHLGLLAKDAVYNKTFNFFSILL